MNTENITDQATATAALTNARKNLDDALVKSVQTTVTLRDTIVIVRPMGVLSVGQMAEAIGRDRNYVDTVWSEFGDVTKGKQTRVAVETDESRRAELVDRLYAVAKNQRSAISAAATARAERDRVVAMVYASKILGPSAIASAVGIDRNHVLRLSRRAGINPAWRPAGTSRNQHSKA